MLNCSSKPTDSQMRHIDAVMRISSFTADLPGASFLNLLHLPAHFNDKPEQGEPIRYMTLRWTVLKQTRVTENLYFHFKMSDTTPS